MSLKKYDVTLGQWVDMFAEKEAFDAHAGKIASNTELGHVKVDGVTITIDENGVISTLGDNGEPIVIEDATLLAKGIVQLSNAIDLDSEALAATPKAVKDAIATAQTFTETKIAELIGGDVVDTLNSIKELADAVQAADLELDGLFTAIGEKASQTDLDTLTQTVTDNKTTSERALQTHIDNTEIHVTQVEKDNWNASSGFHFGATAPADTTKIWVNVTE